MKTFLIAFLVLFFRDLRWIKVWKFTIFFFSEDFWQVSEFAQAEAVSSNDKNSESFFAIVDVVVVDAAKTL